MAQTLLRICAATALLLGSCDNVGRAFDPDLEPPGNGGGTTAEVVVEVVPVGGDARSGRPKVRAAFPEGSGWPLAVPIVVEFSESINQTSLLPTSTGGLDGKVVLRVQGTTTVLPCVYDVLAGGRVLVMRPIQPLSNEQNPTYEVVLLPGGRDCDGVRFDVDEGGEVLTEFQANQDESFTDGRILYTYPRHNARDAGRSTDYLVVFDRPANVGTVTPNSVRLRTGAGASVASALSRPLVGTAGEDGRLVQLRPSAELAAKGRYELVVDATITFGDDGELDFRGRTPYAVFDTVAPGAVTGVTVRGAAPGFADQINRGNFGTLVLDVTTPADAAIGDKLVARIYGGDPKTQPTNDIAFEERIVDVTANGVQTIGVDFSGRLGTLTKPRFDDGDARFAVQLRRGSEQGDYVHNAETATPRYDLTPPMLTQAGPGGSATEFVTDQERPALFGVASERLAAAELAVGSATATLYAASDDGRFLLRPFLLGRSAAPLAYSLLLTDAAGNLATAPVTGNIVQRGVVTGTLAGTLTVEAFDDATLLPVAGATVLVEPGVPTVPATGRVLGTTDANGRATFAVGGASYTVTIVRAGYDLVTFHDSAAAFLSLPLRPTAAAAATGTFTGTVAFSQSPGRTVLVGNSAYDDDRTLAAQSANGTPTAIPETPIRPARPQMITTFVGSFEPTASPSVTHLGYQMLGPTLLTPTPPAAPVAAGATSRQVLATIPAPGSIATQNGSHNVDFALATGLDTANLVGGRPIVRPTISMFGFGGQVLNGAGFATLTGGANYSISWDYGTAAALGFGVFTPLQWVVTEATDTSGRISRHRALFLSLIFNSYPAPSIPVVTAPVGPANGAPLVEFADVLNRAALADAQAVAVVTAADNAGRRWRLYAMDTDGLGGTNSVQFPELGSSSVAGLAAGDWSVLVEARVFWPVPGTTPADFVLAEVRRQEITYARSTARVFTVQ